MLIYKWFFWPWFFTVATIYHAEHKGSNLMSTIYKEKLIHSNFFVIPIRYSTYVLITPPILRVWSWLKVPAKYFIICHDTKKTTWIIIFQKYDKFWSALLEYFIEHKLWNWEESYVKPLFLRFTWLNLKSSALKQQHLFKCNKQFSSDAI